MDTRDFMGEISAPKFRSLTEPSRDINMSNEDVAITDESIDRLDKSGLNTNELFKVFDDWQTKKTLTSKRIFVSTSLLVSSASWIGVDYSKLRIFGLEVANGDPTKLLYFMIIAIVLSGLFYGLSRKIDSSVRRSKIAHVNRDLKYLIDPFTTLKDVMKKHKISSFSDLYFDFRSSITNTSKHNAIDVFWAIDFYRENLTNASSGLRAITIGEEIIIYFLALYAVVSIIIVI